MKRYSAFLMALIVAILLTGCNEQKTNEGDNLPNQEDVVQPIADIPKFSYAEDSKMYSENIPGVKTTGFINTSEVCISTEEDAVMRAKNECTIEWDTVQTYFDTTSGFWKIIFFTEGVLGGCETVYLSGNGITSLVVYGE